jgi:tRNA nucleotidyltransferase (CCA-adding enzyme)
MLKIVAVVLVSIVLLANTCGCVALLAGVAGGAGTATWLSGKLTQDVNVSFERSIDASRAALKSLKLHIAKETVKDNVAQIMSNYTDGKTIWIDIHRLTQSSSRIEVRVGASGDKEAAKKILSKITGRL